VDENKKWRIELSLKIVATIAPFVLVFITMNLQSDSSKKYEKRKLLQIVNHLEGEMGYNLQLLTDTRVAGETKMRPLVSVDSITTLKKQYPGLTLLTNHTRFFIPDIRFKTTIWQTANTRDYFFLIDRVTYYNMNSIYTLYEDYNNAIDRLADLRAKMNSVEQSPARYEFTFNVQIVEARALAKQANDIVSQVIDLGDKYKDATQGELKKLE
jgi:hypothetical protein